MTGENGVPETPDWDVRRVIQITEDDDYAWTFLPALDFTYVDDEAWEVLTEGHIERGSN